MTLIKKISLVIVSLSLVAVSSVSSAKPFSPKKPIELIIPAGQGGGADEIARLVQGVIEKNDYASKPVIPINKKGGSGGEAMTYVKKKAGDDVPFNKKALVVNTGRALEYLSKGKFKATNHRVLWNKQKRLSVPFFFEPSYDFKMNHAYLNQPKTNSSGQSYEKFLNKSLKKFIEYQR